MISEEILLIFEKYIPRKEWNKVQRTSITFEVLKWLKWLSFGYMGWHKKYMLKVTYKNATIKWFPLSVDDKVILKPWINEFNFYVIRQIENGK